MNKNIFIAIVLYHLTFNGICQSNTGYASYYGKEFHGRKTASGEKYNMSAFTAAHRTLPFGTLVKVTNKSNKLSVIVKVNDRGPFSKKRIVDISRAAAESIDMVSDGVVMVEVEVLPTLTNKADSLIFFPKYDSLKIKAEPLPHSTISGIGDLASRFIDLPVGKLYDGKGELKTPQGFGIQVLSISDTKKLLNELDSLHINGFDRVYIEPAIVGTKKSFRILVGLYTDKNGALDDKIKLEQLGYNGFVRKYIATEKPK